MCVDKLVEKVAESKANYTLLSILLRFALFLCNRAFPSAEVPKFCPKLPKQKKKRREPGRIFRKARKFRSSVSQYHLGGFSRWILMVCFASVMSYHRPYVFQPSATT